MYQKNAKRFIEEKIKTATPKELLIMVFDYTLSALKKGDTVSARKGIRELIDSLDFEKGGEIARNLVALYEYCLRQIHSGNLQEAYDIIKEIRDAYAQIT